jgi:hypothetical protein
LLLVGCNGCSILSQCQKCSRMGTGGVAHRCLYRMHVGTRDFVVVF